METLSNLKSLEANKVNKLTHGLLKQFRQRENIQMVRNNLYYNIVKANRKSSSNFPFQGKPHHPPQSLIEKRKKKRRAKLFMRETKRIK